MSVKNGVFNRKLFLSLVIAIGEPSEVAPIVKSLSDVQLLKAVVPIDCNLGT